MTALSKVLNMLPKRAVVSLLALALPSIVLPSRAAQVPGPGDWWMFRHDRQHTARSPFVGPSVPHLKWTFETGDQVDSDYAMAGSSPALGADGTVYVGSSVYLGSGFIPGQDWDGELYAINPDGTQKWAFRTGWGVCGSPAVGADGTVYVGSGYWDGKLFAINPDGTEKWAFRIGYQIVSSPAIGGDGTVYIGSRDGNLYAINPDGTKKWVYQTRDWIWSSPAIGADGTVYAGSWDGNLYAINPDGTVKWAFPTGRAICSSPAIGAEGTVYVGSWDGNLYAINPDGTKKWAFWIGKWELFCSPAIGADGTVHFGPTGYWGYGPLYAINPDGTLKWASEGLWSGGEFGSPSVGADGTVFIGTGDSYLYAINPDGTVKWRYQGTDSFESSPAIGPDGTVYIKSRDGKLYAINDLLPNVTCSVGTSTLWPPEDDLINVGLAAKATDRDNSVLPVAVQVFSNEDELAPASGHFSPDAKDLAVGTLRLRSERRADADGRVYLIVTKATDSSGNTGFCSTTVAVPHDQSAASVSAVAAQAAAAQAYCASHNGAPPAGYFAIGNGPIIGPKQ